MFRRVFFTVRMAWRHRMALKQYIHDIPLQIDTVLHLCCEALKASGIKVLVLDFDGVLAAHGEGAPNKEVFSWLKHCMQVFGLHHVFILSNKPIAERITYFETHLPGIVFMISKKKPYPDGLRAILTRMNIKASELLMVDDRLFTGILAAILVDAKGCWVTHPYVKFSKRPLAETGFWLLRKGEQWLCSRSPEAI